MPALYGHETLRNRLEGAIASSRFPQTAMLTGPAGVGKQRLALWVGAALLCEHGPGAPCGHCEGCRRTQNLTHPDLHWIVPIPRPKASDAAKQIDEAAELIAETVRARVQEGAYRPGDRMHGHPLASIRYVQRVAALTPFRGQRKVFVLGEADRLTVQEASQEAANALLKLLEEPPDDTVVLLTTSVPQALLPTIRSRVVPIRVGRVPDDAVRAFLTDQLSPPPRDADLERRVLLAEGSIGRALADGDEDGDAAQRAEAVLGAARRGAASWSQQALGQTPWAARGAFGTMLDALMISLRRGIEERSRRDDPAAVARWLRAVRSVDAARADTRRNVNPQLALAVLSRELEGLA